MTCSKTLDVEVVLAGPSTAQRMNLTLSAGTQARAAVLLAEQRGMDFNGVGISAASAALGVYSVRIDDNYELNDGDRLEIYRPLQQNPMDLRRQRARQSAKKT